jgi:beta-galactosidase
MRKTKRPIQFKILLETSIAGILLLCGWTTAAESPRERISINNDWLFTRNDPVAGTTGDVNTAPAENLNYPVNPGRGGRGGRGAATEPVTKVDPTSGIAAFILPTGNAFIADPAKRYIRPAGNYGGNVPYVSPDFDDAGWQKLDLPHDYAIEGPFSKSGGGGMGRLSTAGVAWYRKHLAIPASDAGKQIYLDIDGSMSYTTVWCNGQIVGGWPYGYASWRIDLTPYVKFGGDNVLAIRLNNPPNSSRWYPGAGIYRNVWLVETAPVHVGHWGTYLTTPEISSASATISLKVTVDNDSKETANVSVVTRIFEIDPQDQRIGNSIASISPANLTIESGNKVTTETKGTITNPKLWGTGSHQKPNRYVAVTTVEQNGKTIDTYETTFGIRTLKFDPNEGFFLNGEHIRLNGVCDHHDLGALGAAVNYRALQRQLEILADMGCNAIRTSHNPPAPELLELADKMGFLIMDEAFDVWVRQKTPYDYHLVYPEWHEQDLRTMLRRDRNHPSVFMWSIGNEVGEQFGGSNGAAIAKELTDICHEEDPTRPTISGMNSARADSPFPVPIDTIGLNYQGTGVRSGPPQYPVFHEKFPDKFIVGTETASTLSSRGVYTFPVVSGLGVPASAKEGEEPDNRQVSSYDLYSAPWSYSPDKEFISQHIYPYVAGEFVWTGWDYLGEPTPFDASRSSYFGIIDLAGFKKDRFYLYQAHWRPDLPMANILPHWTWPERVGQVTPVHVYTSGDEAELFLNGKSLGRKKKIFDMPDQPMSGEPAYRIRWDDVVYEPGELKVIAFKDGKEWATDIMRTAGEACQMELKPDRDTINADGCDLSFVTLTVQDNNDIMVPRANNLIRFSVSGPGEIVATDNGDPTDFKVFSSHERKAFNGLALVIIRGKPGQPGTIKLKADSDSLESNTIILHSGVEKADAGVVQ